MSQMPCGCVAGKPGYQLEQLCNAHELLIALKRLVVHATEFQKWAQNFDESDTTDHNLTVSLQLAQEAIDTVTTRAQEPG